MTTEAEERSRGIINGTADAGRRSHLSALSHHWQIDPHDLVGSIMVKREVFFVLVISLVGELLISSCGTPVPPRQTGLHSPPMTAALPPPPPVKENDTAVQVGEASWYGARFHGKETSAGERYDQNKLTAAHPTLPAGSKVKVTNMENGKSVNVRVNDRGPYIDGRIIDVSRKAAKKLDMVEEGTTAVKVEVISKPTQTPVTKINDTQHQ